jgi:hypothetical protein
MIELFFCTVEEVGKHTVRSRMADLSLERWKKETSVRIEILTPSRLKCTALEFQSRRRIWADSVADGPFYIVADDDCLLGGPSTVDDAIGTMIRYPEFRILSLLPQNATINPWTPEGYVPFVDDDVMEHVSVGQVRFCRKGILKEWPWQSGMGYDTAQCAAIRREGKRVGYFRNIKANHLGEGYSTVWR